MDIRIYIICIIGTIIISPVIGGVFESPISDNLGEMAMSEPLSSNFFSGNQVYKPLNGDSLLYKTGEDAPVLKRVKPNNATQGQSLEISMEGSNFKPGAIVNLTYSHNKYEYEPNITLPILFINSTFIKCNMTIPNTTPAMSLMPHRIYIQQGSQYSSPASFFIKAKSPSPNDPPVISHLDVYDLDKIYPGEWFYYYIDGTNFQPGAILNLTMTGAPNITLPISYRSTFFIAGNMKLPNNISPGLYRVVIQQGSLYSVNNVFCPISIKTPSQPFIRFISPSCGWKGLKTHLDVIGRDLSSDTLVVLVKKGSRNITLSDIICTDSFSLQGNLTLPANTTAGTWIVVAQKGGLFSNINVTFNVTEAQLSLTKINPTTGIAGTSVPFTLMGTGFKSGIKVNLTPVIKNEIHSLAASVAAIPNITTSSIRVQSTTQLTGVFSIPCNAKAMKYRVVANIGVNYSTQSITFAVTTCKNG